MASSVMGFLPVHILGEQPSLHPRLAIDLGDFMDRCLDTRGHVADAAQG
jgi:hypothetical protein